MPKKNRMQNAALSITRWIGSVSSLIVHTIAFIGFYFAVYFGVIGYDEMLLVLTTVVSLEAIYLSIFIQMTINFTSETVEDISEDVDEIQQDIDEIQEDVDELQEDVEEIEEEGDADEARKREQRETLTMIQKDLRKLMSDIERLQNPVQ